MARKKGGPNKSAAVREYLKDHPGASANEVSEALNKQGIKITAALVYNVRANDNKKAATGGARRSRSTKGASHGSKAEAIREAFERLGPNTRARDVIADLAGNGVEVTNAHVANVRARMGSPASRSGARSTSGTTRSAAGGVSLDQLLAAKNMAEKLGGIDSARRMLDALEQLAT